MNKIKRFFHKGLVCGECRKPTNNRLIGKAGGVCPNCGHTVFSCIPKRR